MKVLGRKKLDDFKMKHADACVHVDCWVQEAEKAKWLTPHNVKASYPKASILKGGIVVFNIKGNDYRLKVKIEYKNGVILITNLGKHSEYDNW